MSALLGYLVQLLPLPARLILMLLLSLLFSFFLSSFLRFSYSDFASLHISLFLQILGFSSLI